MKKITFLSLIVLIICFSINAYASTPTTIEESASFKLDSTTETVRDTIKDYFELYFKGLETLEVQNYESLFVSSDETLKIAKSHEYNIEMNKMWNIKQINNKVKINYISIENIIGGYKVDLKLSGTNNYSTTPDVESGFADLDYTFYLMLDDGSYKIIDIDTDDDIVQKFDIAINRFNKDVKERNYSSYEEELDYVIEKGKERLKNTMSQISTVQVEEPTEESKNSEAQTRATVSYNHMLGRNYAQEFALVDNASETWFYYISMGNGGDCTNFVSQCVWAAYGGYVEGPTSETATKANINNKFRMINNVWHAGTGGGMPAWENVQSFWNYVTTNTGNGPKAYGYNNNLSYTGVPASSIDYGDVLQFSWYEGDVYRHSGYVTYTSSATDTYPEVLVSFHSNPYYNRPLAQMFDTYDCMRRMSFRTTTFAN